MIFYFNILDKVIFVTIYTKCYYNMRYDAKPFAWLLL